MKDVAPDLLARIHELERRVEELDRENLHLEREIGRRGVKLNCANIALSRAKIAYDEQARHREEAVQDIAHDLRTPLTSIRGAAQNVLDGIAGPLDDRLRGYVELIHGQSTRLLDVVNWLLQAIRITGEPRSLDAAQVDLGALLGSVAAGLRPLAEERGVALDLDSAEIVICADAAKLHQVFENLVANALKFTERGGAVRISAVRYPDQAAVVVSDSGVGMDDDALARIFHRYYRAHPEREGSGLGLLIARELVRLHGGDITVESEPAKGSTFTVWLPAGELEAG
jgi:signal transduction histidine kinase